ncbi:pleckstrin homology domain-containing family G member 3 [Hyla sarda]|uniref:pleckstrin homology domain-containing family G member 3 n=1 Tax=Hyla sarda TaxID=327740 RepID=UPI0024C33E47|nr:pleckstrin homology domain-containing family G member 3 [Hyla sarda]
MFEERGRFEGFNRRISRLFESPRFSAFSSYHNDKLPSTIPLGTEYYDTDYPLSVTSTPTPGSLGEAGEHYENIIGESVYHAQLSNSTSDLDMELLSATAETIQATFQSGLKNGNATNSNNNVNRYSHMGSGSFSPFGSKVNSNNRKLNYVERVVLEIIETERMYVQDLRSIVEDYLGGIIDKHELPMKPEQVSALFGNIEDIYELNSRLLQDLYSCSEDPVAVASCFVEKSHYFDIYTQYCNNYPNSVATLTECMRNKVLGKFFRERQEMLKHSLPLGSFLLKPVQRILKYHLLLQEIAKHFDMDKEGYEVVEEAIETMTGVAWYINDMKRKHEHAVRQQEIQSLLLNWKGLDLTTYGELVLEGTFRVQRARSERTFFLFDKALLITKKRGDHFVYKTHIPCSHLMLIESTRDSLCFTLTHYKNSKQQHNVEAKTVEEKRLWTHHIKKLILENHHAIIPQKAKEAILEMDAMYPGRYRYSPERVKKTMSAVDPIAQRSGRRQSEPIKNMLKDLDEKVNLKHSGSDEALLDFGDLLQHTMSVLTPSGNDPQTEGEKDHPATTELIRGPEAELSAPEEEDHEDDMQMEDNGQHKDSLQYDISKGFKRQNSHSPGNPEKRRSIEVTAFNQEVLDEKNNSEPEEVYIADMITTSEIDIETSSATTDNQSFEEGSETYFDVCKPLENGIVEHAEDIKTFSSEEDEEETGIHESSSILPPSVLDQASVIAERFLSNHSRRSSLALDDGKVIGYITPRHLSRSSSLINLDGTDKSLCQYGSSDFLKSHQVVLPNGEMAYAEPSLSKVNSVESVFEEKDRPVCKPRESILSFQDQQLIDKIKTYYDKAEHQDASFSIKRRESLTYIPTGVVKNSIFKINSLPRYDGHLSSYRRQRIESSSGSIAREGRQHTAHVDTSTTVEAGGNANSTQHTQPSGTSAKSEDLDMPPPVSDEEFRSSSEMVKVWEEMEKERGYRTNEDSVSHPGKTPLSIENPMDSHEPLIILEESDLSTIKEESQNNTPDPSSPEQLRNQQETMNFGNQDYKTPVKDHPTLAELASYMDVNLPENIKNRVYQLARQYSQRIKCNKPVAHRRLREIEDDMRRGSLPSVKEEKNEGKCKLKTVFSFPLYEPIVSQDHSPTTPTPTSYREKSPKRLSFNSPESPDASDYKSPLSPVKTEKFHWPDVRELRSRYSSTSGTSRSQSVPDKMMDHNAEYLPDTQNKDSISPSYKRFIRHSESMNGVVEEINLFDKIPSQPSNMAVSPKVLHNGDSGQIPYDGYYISAETPLENDKKVIIIEKIPFACDVDDTYVHIRSPTTREKISIKAVVERCKAYQESEEYKMREEVSCTDGSADVTQDHSKPKVLTTSDAAQQNRVKNLREKFQTLNSKVGKHLE